MALLKPSGKTLNVTIGHGLPSNSKPSGKRGSLGFPLASQQSRPQHPNPTAQHMQSPTRAATRGPAPPRPTGPPGQAAGPPRPAQPMGRGRGSIRAPPPPSEPAPPNQPILRAASKAGGHGAAPIGAGLLAAATGGGRGRPAAAPATGPSQGRGAGPAGSQASANSNSHFMQPPQAGLAGVKRASAQGGPKPVPGGGKPRPPTKPANLYPKAQAMFDYSAQDLDELSFKEGDVVEIMKEHEGGWWLARKGPQQGLIPANYVRKL